MEPAQVFKQGLDERIRDYAELILKPSINGHPEDNGWTLGWKFTYTGKTYGQYEYINHEFDKDDAREIANRVNNFFLKQLNEEADE